MKHTKTELYQKIKDLITKKEFDDKIKNLQKEYDDLIDDDTIALLIVDELGRNKENICKIIDIKDGVECTLIGKVVKINDTRSFNRKNGSNGKVVNIELSDETGNCTLVLWNNDVELIKSKKIKKGSNIKIINGYIKNGYTGLEINVGKYGLIEILEENELTIKKTNNSKSENIFEGEIINIQPTRAFFKDDGEFGFVTNVNIKSDEKELEITVWDEKVKEIQNFRIGDKIQIENIDKRQKNGNLEFHLNGSGKIKKL
ncbi:MAG: OB-fold nucleic acid binding domain-containing protein [Candidatus Thermoplasmatota archaeon]|nr:OB-fold nucleic acid binding domain-containing protein [Candidatus Thermoplasmatota archaeon]